MIVSIIVFNYVIVSKLHGSSFAKLFSTIMQTGNILF